MGCSSSSTQTVAQENRPGTKPEETNGDTGFVASVVGEDAETIEDQMHLPVQSALPEELGPGPGDSEALYVCEAVQSSELVAEGAVEMTIESDFIQTTGDPESAASDEPAPTEPLTLQKESSPVEVVTAQEDTMASVAVEELCPAEAAAPDDGSAHVENAEIVSPVDAEATVEPVISAGTVEVAASVEASSETSGAEQDQKATTSPEETIAELIIAPESVATPELTSAVEPSPTPEPTPVSEPDPCPESTEIVEATQDSEPTSAVEPPPAAEPSLIIESCSAPEPTQKETPIPGETDPNVVEDSALSDVQPQLEPSVPAPSTLEPVHVETAAAAAEVVLLAAQEQAALSAVSDDAITIDQAVMQAPENLEGGVEEGAVSQDISS